MFTVLVSFWKYLNRGTRYEEKFEDYAKENGPFETRQSAEAFARNIATQADVARVTIKSSTTE